MSPVAVFSFVIIALGMCFTSVTGLKCHCDFCSRNNNTCETDGFCLSLSWLQRETGIIHHAFRCLDRKMYFPRPYPSHCSLESSNDIAVKSACCSRDMCNLQLTPPLDVVREVDLKEWFRRPRNRTQNPHPNVTRLRTLARGPALNFINSTEQLDE